MIIRASRSVGSGSRGRRCQIARRYLLWQRLPTLFDARLGQMRRQVGRDVARDARILLQRLSDRRERRFDLGGRLAAVELGFGLREQCTK